MLDFLPASSFTAFEARKLARASLVWRNNKLPQTAWLERFAYAVPAAHDGDGDHLPASKTFLAERYGGDGIVNNGGGVRCGYADGLQVKGIGQNPLAGGRPDFWYSHGGATLEEAIREAAWGEVCHAALPYGGVRVHAIIASGKQVPFDGEQGKCTVAGALIVRDAALRPAHFMRAALYRPDPAVAARQVGDVERTRAAIARLAPALHAMTAGAPPPPPTSPLYALHLNAGLQEMARRFAVQLAAARIKKIIHGAFSCSNIGLDGRLLDYGTITTVADYRRIIVARGQPDMLGEHAKLLLTLKETAFYCNKFLPEAVRAAVLTGDDLGDHFLHIFHQRIRIEMLKLSGLPEAAVQALPADVAGPMIEAINAVLRAGDCEPFKLYTKDAGQTEWRMPEGLGDYHLNTIMRRICLCGSPAQAGRELAPLLGDAALRQRFVQAYWRLRQAYLASKPARCRGHATLYLALNAYRLNGDLPLLYRPHLVRRIEGMLAAPDLPEQVDLMLRQLRAHAATQLAEPRDQHLDLFAWTGRRLQFDETRLRTQAGKPLPPAELIEALDAKIFNHEQKQQLLEMATMEYGSVPCDA